ncbi:MAG: helix-turn-helix domain-containing protein [Ostreibacterium sp.]
MPIEKKKKNQKIEKEIKQLVEQYFSMASTNTSSTLHQDLIQRVERALIKNVLKKSGHNQCKARKILGISRTTLRKKMAKFKLLTLEK